MKRFIVTGGYGFIGSNLIKLLLKKKFKVLNIDKLSYSAQKYNLKDIKSKNYFFKKTDINNKKEILKILKRYKPHGIFNLAADTHVDRSIDDSSNFIKNNILGVYNLLEAIINYKKKVRLVHISTDEVYGDISGSKRSDESFPYIPSSPYSASKASSDHLVNAFIRTYKIDAVISNCSNNYGPRQFPEKLIPVIISRAIKNKQIPIYGKGKNIRDWIHVQDHVDALYKILLKGKIGKTYNIGSENEISNIDLAKKICTLLDEIKPKKNSYKKQLAFVKDRLGHDYRYAINSNLIKKELAWKPKIKFNDGLKKTIKWYLKNHSYLKYK